MTRGLLQAEFNQGKLEVSPEGTAMVRRLLIVAYILALAVARGRGADVNVVVDNFESYASDAALLAAWPSSDPSRPNNGTKLTTDSEEYYGGRITGKAAEFCGSSYPAGIFNCGGTTSGGGTVNYWATPFQIAPSALQNIELVVDIGDDAFSMNKRLTLGLRSTTPLANIIELGLYNAPSHFAYRTAVFASGSIPDPGWSTFGDDSIEQPLAPELDTPFEVGAAFHRFKAVISQSNVTFSLDLYADGKTNSPLNPVPGVGPSGVDAMDVVNAITDANGYDRLQFGIPSAQASSGGTEVIAAFAAFDNISLRLVDIPGASVAGDYNKNGVIDAADYTVWRDTRGSITNPVADSDADGVITATDYNYWRWRFGATSGESALLDSSMRFESAVPEPDALWLAAVGIVGGLMWLPHSSQRCTNDPCPRRMYSCGPN